MSGSYVLDTNMVIAFLADEHTVRERVATAPAIFIPSIVVGELYYGAFKSAWSPRNIERIERFLQHTTLLVTDHITAYLSFGSLRLCVSAVKSAWLARSSKT